MNAEAECHPSTLQKHTPEDKVHAGITAALPGWQGRGSGWQLSGFGSVRLTQGTEETVPATSSVSNYCELN